MDGDTEYVLICTKAFILFYYQNVHYKNIIVQYTIISIYVTAIQVCNKWK